MLKKVGFNFFIYYYYYCYIYRYMIVKSAKTLYKKSAVLFRKRVLEKQGYNIIVKKLFSNM